MPLWSSLIELSQTIWTTSLNPIEHLTVSVTPIFMRVFDCVCYPNSSKLYRWIHADVIVYIFSHLHTALRTEGNMLDLNWLQAAKKLAKLSTWWNVLLFWWNIQGGIDQFRYIKIQPKTQDLSTRFWGITTEFVGFIPQSLVLRSIVLGWILIYRNWSIVFQKLQNFWVAKALMSSYILC